MEEIFFAIILIGNDLILKMFHLLIESGIKFYASQEQEKLYEN